MTIGRTKNQTREPTSQTGAWVPITVFGTNWENIGGTFYDAAYRLLDNGTVELRGFMRINGGVGDVNPFNLPAEARPGKDVQVAITGSESLSFALRTFSIDTAGDVNLGSAPLADGDSYALDGIRFALDV